MSRHASCATQDSQTEKALPSAISRRCKGWLKVHCNCLEYCGLDALRMGEKRGRGFAAINAVCLLLTPLSGDSRHFFSDLAKQKHLLASAVIKSPGGSGVAAVAAN